MNLTNNLRIEFYGPTFYSMLVGLEYTTFSRFDVDKLKEKFEVTGIVIKIGIALFSIEIWYDKDGD